MDSDSSDDLSVQDIYTKIIEQPARSVRFRYECETKYPANIPGINSSKRKKTYPTIQVVGHRGKAVAVVSCVTKDPPHTPHCHNLVGRNCTLGVCTTPIPTDTMTVAFDNMGIRCVKKRDIAESLKVRKQVRVDPFRTGFNGSCELIDINSVRLAFQVFIQLGILYSGNYLLLGPVVDCQDFRYNRLLSAFL